MRSVLLFLLLAFASLGLAQTTGYSSSNYLVASEVKTSPVEIYAGDNVNLSLVLYNVYDYSASDVIVQLTGGYPLLELSPTQTYRINSIASGIGQLGLEPLKFKLSVDPNAPAGTYSVNVVATYATLTETKLANGATSTLATVKTDTIPVSIRVRGAPHLTGSAISQGVEPGVRSLVTLSIINDGTDIAKGASISLESTEVFEVLGTSSAYLGDMPAGGSAQASFSIRAGERAPSTKHDLPIELKYRNKYGKEFGHSADVPIMVSVYEPSLEVSVSDQTSRPRAGEDSVILLEVRNRGDGLAKNARISVSGSGPLEVKWPTDNISLGDIPGGMAATATVRVKAEEGATQQSTSLPVKLTYMNSNKQKSYEDSDVLAVDLERSANFKVVGSSSELRPDTMWKQVAFVVKNTGNTNANEIKVTLNTQYPIAPSGKNQYISGLAPGENTTVYFHVDVDSGAVPQEYPIDIYFEWKEDGDRTYTTAKSYSVEILPQEGDVTPYAAAGGLLVLLVAGLALRKKRKGKKK